MNPVQLWGSPSDNAVRKQHDISGWKVRAEIGDPMTPLKELNEIDGPSMMNETGTKLLKGLEEVAEGHGYDLKTSGHPSMPYLRITDDESLMLHQDWCAECTRRGAYFTSHHNWFVSTAHTQEDLDRTFDIADDAFTAIKEKYQK